MFGSISKRIPVLYLVAAMAMVALWPELGLPHGRGVGVIADACRIRVSQHWVHFTAYQPELAGTEEYCSAVPETGKTIVVFDYEGKALRRMTVEFEITREPEGSRVFYQPAAAHPNGSTNATIDFKEAGNYLAHVTLINEGQEVDAHVPFTVGLGTGGPSWAAVFAMIAVVGAVAYILSLSDLPTRLFRRLRGKGAAA